MMLNLGRLAAVFLLLQMFSATQASSHVCRFGKYSVPCHAGFQCHIHNVFGIRVGLCGCGDGHVRKGSACVPKIQFHHARNCIQSRITHGSAQPSSHTIRHSTFVFYKCNHGYERHGTMISLCHDGKFEARPPTCKPIRCPISRIQNGFSNIGLFEAEITIPYMSKVIYSCNAGFTLIGAAMATCRHDKTLSSPPPKCQANTPNTVYTANTAIQCPITKIDNGFSVTGASQKSESSIPYMGTVAYYCKAGFSLVGAAMATCRYDSTLSAPPPKCQENVYKPKHDFLEDINKPKLHVPEDIDKPKLNVSEDVNKPKLNVSEDVNKPKLNVSEDVDKPKLNVSEDVDKPKVDFLVPTPACLPLCHNGECVRNDTYARCECYEGWTGPTCHVCTPGNLRCPVPTEPWLPSNVFLFGSDIFIAIACIVAATCVKKRGICCRSVNRPRGLAQKSSSSIVWLGWLDDASPSHSHSTYQYSFEEKPTTTRSNSSEGSPETFSLSGVSLDPMPPMVSLGSKVMGLSTDNEFEYCDLEGLDANDAVVDDGDGFCYSNFIEDDAKAVQEQHEQPNQLPFANEVVVPDPDVQFTLRYSLVNDLPQQFETANCYVHTEDRKNPYQYSWNSTCSTPSRKQSQPMLADASSMQPLQIVRNSCSAGYIDEPDMMRRENDYSLPARHRSQREQVLNRSFCPTGSDACEREEILDMRRISASSRKENDIEINALITSLQKPTSTEFGTDNLTWYRRSMSDLEGPPVQVALNNNGNSKNFNDFLSVDESTLRRFSLNTQQQGSSPMSWGCRSRRDTISSSNHDKLFTGVAGNGPVSTWDEVFDNSQPLTMSLNYSRRPSIGTNFSPSPS